MDRILAVVFEVTSPFYALPACSEFGRIEDAHMTGKEDSL